MAERRKVIRKRGKLESRLKKLLLALKSRLKKLYVMVERGKMTSKKLTAGAGYRSGSWNSTADADGIGGNPWFFGQILFPTVSD